MFPNSSRVGIRETAAGDAVIMSTAGRVSRAMLSRYSHVRMEAQRRALDEIATRRRAAVGNRRSGPIANRPQVNNLPHIAAKRFLPRSEELELL
jgi:hypothetical protein